MAFPRPVGGTVVDLDDPKTVVVPGGLTEPRERVVGAAIQGDHEFEVDALLPQHRGRETRDDPFLVVRRHDDRDPTLDRWKVGPLGGTWRETIDSTNAAEHQGPVDAGPETEHREHDREGGGGRQHGPGMVPRTVA